MEKKIDFQFLVSFEDEERMATAVNAATVEQGIDPDIINEILGHCLPHSLPKIRYSATGATQDIIFTFLEDKFRRDVANATNNNKLLAQDEALVGIEE